MITLTGETTLAELSADFWRCSESAESPPEGELLLSLVIGALKALIVAPKRHLLTAGDKRIAFECDGLAFHEGQAAFARDRKRDRDLAGVGIETYRFTAAEILGNPLTVQREVFAVILRAFGLS